MKRLFDLFWTSLGLILLWPLFVLIAALIKHEDGGPIFFRQVRIGLHGVPFRIWKFRTMVPDAPGIPLTVGCDPRITRTGHWLRKLKFDELPQLFNVFAGQMSLVGPRPEVARYVDAYTPEQTKVLQLSPGITDIASVRYCNESDVLAQTDDPERTYREEIVPAKIGLNLEYAKHATIASDFLVIIQTFLRLTRCRRVL
jgi:lipopolysaccharide/colanic/teichoic acid biosynthesis glycosyltransferase